MKKRLYFTLLPLAAGIVLFSLISFLPQHKSDTTYRDLNKNGRMDVYEDVSQSVEARVSDLLAQMNLEEKAGMMFINGVMINDDGTLDRKPNAEGFAAQRRKAGDYIRGKKMNHFNYWQVPGVLALADGYNAMQKMAENSRLGIPVTIASDPRHYFSNNIFAMAADGFSQWPEQAAFTRPNTPAGRIRQPPSAGLIATSA